jgi:aminoglycoside 3-N-acetyltransferase
MVSYRDVVNGLARLDISRENPVIVHASLSSFGSVHGGAQTVIGSLLATWNTVLMPSFTYRTMVIPEQGPSNNGLKYGSGRDVNKQSTPFFSDMPVDRLIGVIPDNLRIHPNASRSNHPILSFVGVNANKYLAAQTFQEPLAPIRILHENQGWVILLGVDLTANTSIHQAERLAGRKQFIRWAMVRGKVVECPAIPGCSDGFEKASSLVEPITRIVSIGSATIQALPLAEMIPLLVVRLRRDPFSLLCDRLDCERCNAVRASIRHQR